MFTRFCESRRRFSLLLSLKYIISFFLPAPSVPVCSCLLCVPWLPCVPVPCSVLCVCAPEAPRRPSACPAAVCRLVAAVTRPPSGAKQCGSVGRCTAYMSPAVSVSPLAYVLPCVPLSVPWLVLPAAVCRLVAIIGGTPLYPGRRLFGAASEV